MTLAACIEPSTWHINTSDMIYYYFQQTVKSWMLVCCMVLAVKMPSTYLSFYQSNLAWCTGDEKGQYSCKWTWMTKNQSGDKDFIFVGFCTSLNVQLENRNVWNSPAVTWSAHHFELTTLNRHFFTKKYHVIVLYVSNSSKSDKLIKCSWF